MLSLGQIISVGGFTGLVLMVLAFSLPLSIIGCIAVIRAKQEDLPDILDALGRWATCRPRLTKRRRRLKTDPNRPRRNDG